MKYLWQEYYVPRTHISGMVTRVSACLVRNIGARGQEDETKFINLKCEN